MYGRCQGRKCTYQSDVDAYFDDERQYLSLCGAHANGLWDDPHMIQVVPQHGGPSMIPMKVIDNRPVLELTVSNFLFVLDHWFEFFAGEALCEYEVSE